MESIIVAVALIAGMLIGFAIYRQGLKDGKPVAEGKELKPIIKKKVAKEKSLSPDEVGLFNILMYDGTEQKGLDDE